MHVLLTLSILSGWGPACSPAVAGPLIHVPILMPAVEIRPAPPVPSRPKPPTPKPPRVIGRKCECGEGCPHKGCPDGCACAAELPTGVDRSGCSKTPRITDHRGKEIAKPEAMRMVGQLVDDSQKHRLTLVGGSVTERKALRKLLEAEDWLKPLVLIQDYEEGHWAVKAFPRKGGLAVFLQRPDGTVLHGAATEPLEALRDKLKRALGLLPPLAPLIAPVIAPAVAAALKPYLVPALLGLILFLLIRKPS